jgi:general secretion pathway protein D
MRREWIRMRRVLIAILIASVFGMVALLRAQEAADQEEPSSEVQPPATPPAQIPPGVQPSPAPAPPERRMVPSRTPRGGMISLNFNRADLVEVIHILAQHLGINYTIDPEVRGTVTIYSAQPISQEDLFPIFHQILRINGAVAVKNGDLYRIALIKDAKGIARPQTQGKEDSFALEVVPLRFFSVAEMKKLLTPFVTPGGEILDYPRGNFLIIVDLPSNIRRLVDIKDLIDVNTFAGTHMELYQPKVASAEDLATEMAKVMQAYASSAPQTEGFAAQFIPIPRINQLLVISHSAAAWTYVQRWLEKIDTVGEGPGRRIFIYPVENGKATDLADILNEVLGLSSGGTTRRERPRTLEQIHRGGLPGSTGTGTLGGQSYGPYGTTPSMTGTPSTTGSAFAAAATPAQPPPAVIAPPGVAARPSAPPPQQPGVKAEEQLRIVADPATNSLIVYSSAQEFQNIKSILKELDIMPRQVLLDVMAAEVTLTDSQSLGIEYEILAKKSGVTIFNQTFPSQGAIRSGILPSGIIGSALSSSDFTPFPPGLSGIIGSNDLKVFINALMTDSRVKVLSSPSVLATDNSPARIQVGSEEPVPTGTITAAVGQPTVSSSTTIQYRSTGRIVTIIPQVNSQGLVNLQILAEFSQRGPNVRVGTDDFPSFATRNAETTAVVQDGETLVIGGIIAENKTRDRKGIPYLMDIPVLGRFFGGTTDTTDRTELLLLISPHVIRNTREGRDVTQDFKQRVSAAARELERMKKEQAQGKPVTPQPPTAQP